MTRTAFLKKHLLKFAVALALLGVIVYLFSHALGLSSGSLHNIAVRSVKEDVVTSTSAYLFRDERVLSVAESGLVDPLVKNGEKVGKNAVVANFYPRGGDVSTDQLTLDDLNAMKVILEESDLPAGTPISHANGYRDQARLEYQKLRETIVNGSFTKLSSLEDDFLIYLNRYIELSGKGSDTSYLLDLLEAKKQELLQGASTDVINGDDGQLRTSGTFFDRTYVDGYEAIYTPQALESLTPESFAAIKNASAAEDGGGTTVGKMVYGYSFHLAMEMENAVAERFKAGSSYKFVFPENDDCEIILKLESSTPGEEQTLLVFRSDDTPPGFSYYRVQTAVITLETHEGFYIPDSAVQTRKGENGEIELGVFVFENSIVRFRRIETLYEGDGYLIVAPPTLSEITELEENDILITSGKNLYDGKGY